jgi:hypothetical protein
MLLSGSAVAAQSSSPQPKLQETLVASLTAIEGGTCPAKLMSPLVQYQCEKVLPQLQPALQQQGAIQKTSFLGIQNTPDGRSLEAYRVTFERGEAFWMIGVDDGGRVTGLFPG